MALWNEWSGLQRLLALKAAGIIGGGASFVWQTVTGALPLTLTNAVAKGIKSLVQFGKVTTVDGDLYCNNGKLVAVHRSGLPSGYTLLDSVGGSGSQWVITNTYLASTDVVECEFRNSTTTGYGAVYGIYKTGDSSALYGNQTYYGYDVANNKVDTGVAVNTDWHTTRHDFVNGTLTIDDTTVTFEPFEFANSTKNAVLSRYYNGSYGYGWKGYVRKFKVTRGNEVICDLLPCKNEQDVAGFYDLVAETFYAPTGGTLLEGNVVDDYELAIVGTAEVMTVSASGAESQTASVANLFSTGTVHDEQDIITGVITRKVEVDVSGGVITMSALAEPYTESVTPQPLKTVAGDNTVTAVSNVDPVTLSVTYAKRQEIIAYEASNIITDGESYIDTGVYLFSADNIDRDFEFVATGIHASTTNPNNITIVCAKHDGTSRGFQIRANNSSNNQYTGTINTWQSTNESITVKRVNGVLSASGGITNAPVPLVNGVHDHPLVLGCALQDDGTPYRFVAGRIDHLIVKWL